jgi:hypothetical protein
MASSYYGDKMETYVKGMLIPGGGTIDTWAEVKDARSHPRIKKSPGNNFILGIQEGLIASLSPQPAWISRKRIRHDLLKLFREGRL